MRTVLVTLIGPQRTSDLVVDADRPVAELLPSLLAATGISVTPAEARSWTVAVTGKQPVAADQTLEQSGILDGAVLVLRRQDTMPGARVMTAPLRGSEPAGSPLQRTRALLSAQVAPPPRRNRLRPQIPESALTPDGRQQALELAVAEVRLDRCVTIAVLSPKGGVGKTTVSILLGEMLCALRSDQVLALDADSDYGSLGRVGAALRSSEGGEPRDEIFSALARGAVTFAELDRTLWALPGGLRIVPSPRDPSGMARADRSVYTRVLGNLQRLAGVLVIDCGTGLGQPGVQAAVLACDQLVLLTDASGATASLAVEAFNLLERAGRPVTVVCNRLRRGRPGSDDLIRLDALFPRVAGLVGIPDEASAESALRGELEINSIDRTLRQGTLDLVATLALRWGSLHRPASGPV